ncbi:MAG: ABC transporter ATP-binding protein [Alphaproteobacteria bacterium]|nr:ABC transporter ATP-binding protein [Alphaproteobacteria bacterium]
MPQILVDDLSKRFRVAVREAGLLGAMKGLALRRTREVIALDRVSFSLEAGELLGLIGPNGAGKSTTIKILSGIMRPSSGRCEVGGLVPWTERVRHVARIGVVFGQRTQLWWDLPVVESFELLADIYRVSAADYAKRRDELVALLKIDSLLDTPVRQLSLGQRMRCEIASSLLHAPSILFLDEPTIGLDAVSKLALRDFVRTLNRERGVTVILTTHDMHDIEALARRVIVIGNGRLLRDSSFEAMRAEVLNERRLMVELGQDVSEVRIEGARLIAREGRTLTFSFDPEDIPARALIDRIASAYEVEDIRIQDAAIEEVIARFYALHGATEA